MLQIILDHHDRPDLACKVIETDPPGAPGPDEAVMRLKAAAINPADLLMFQARYPGPRKLPAAIGAEGAGVITAIGKDVEHLSVGDHVMSMNRTNWAEEVRGPAKAFIPLPKDLPWHMAAQMLANPPSAHLMLTNYRTLGAGDFVIQNAANSAVGRHIIRMAKARGIKSVNIVRRESLIDELKDIGADHVFVEQEGLQDRVRDVIGRKANLPLGIDAIGGQATFDLADCLSRGGVIVNYGYLSGQPCQFSPSHTIVRALTLTGFWLVDELMAMSTEEVIRMYQDLAGQFMRGELLSPVEASYDLSDGIAAIAHAMRESRNGKILLTANAD